MTSRAAIEAFLARPAIAIAGVSRSGKKFGNLAWRELRAKGYRVYAIHPSADVIDGERCYRTFADLPEPVDALLVVVPPGDGASLIPAAAAAGVRRVWLQQGASSDALLKLCESLNLEVVSGECILMFARPASYHKVHRWVWGLLGKLPA